MSRPRGRESVPRGKAYCHIVFTYLTLYYGCVLIFCYLSCSAAAWDTVEELSAAASHAKDNKVVEDPLEKFCEEDPSADECRVYED